MNHVFAFLALAILTTASPAQVVYEGDSDISFVGPYHPTTFGREGGRNGIKPGDLAGWDTPIMNPDAPVGRPAPEKKPKEKGKGENK